MGTESMDHSPSIGLRALQGFSEIMRTGSATAAGRVLGLSQPAVSRLLSQLEQDIGFELFYRDRGRLVPTKDGLALLEEVNLALAGVDRVKGLIRDLATHSIGEIRILAPPSFAEALLPGLVAKFVQRFPGVRVMVDSHSIGTIKSMISTRVSDCAFMRLPIDHDGLMAETLLTSRTVCVLRRDHPLARHDILSPELIGQNPIVALGTGNVYGLQIEQAFISRKTRMITAAETHTIGSACALAGNGVGIAIVNELLARDYIKPDMTTVPFEPSINHSYALVTLAQPRPPRLLQEFRSVAIQHFSSFSENASGLEIDSSSPS